MDNIVVITQNVKLESLSKLTGFVKPNSETLVVSTQLIFENEAELINLILGSKCTYLNFSDLMTDAEEEQCDIDAFNPKTQGQDVLRYYSDIKRCKNERIIEKLHSIYPAKHKYIVCDDLGIDAESWLNAGYQKIEAEYYYKEADYSSNAGQNSQGVKVLNKVKKFIRTLANIKKSRIYVGYDGRQKYLFFGKMHRIAYRLSIQFKEASFIEKVRYTLDKRGVNTQPATIRLATIHEGYHTLPDRADLNYHIVQDGYMPPDYGSNYLYFYGHNTRYYTWDVEGLKMFKKFNLPCEVLPIRKKLYLPQPTFPNKIKKVLCVASGAGDWTAIKNRSDEDKMVVAFGKIASMFPDVEFVYRCHPVWISPSYQGVNSINRVIEYFEWLHLGNIHVSSNIPTGGLSNVSFQRSSLEEDLKNADIVFGEHSISMIDAALDGILFCSVNVTGRRDLFRGISEMGFPHCESVDEIATFIKGVGSEPMKKKYLSAVEKYNEMTDLEQ